MTDKGYQFDKQINTQIDFSYVDMLLEAKRKQDKGETLEVVADTDLIARMSKVNGSIVQNKFEENQRTILQQKEENAKAERFAQLYGGLDINDKSPYRTENSTRGIVKRRTTSTDDINTSRGSQRAL